jgi:putative phosphoesterase
MHIAVLADIHGNLPALETALEEIGEDRVDGFIVAGDMIGGPNPVEVLERLRDLGVWMIRGNNENYILKFAAGEAPKWWYTARQWAFMHWNFKQMDQGLIEFLKNLPEQKTVAIPETMPIRIVHGSPRDISELVYPDKDISLLDIALQMVSEPVLVFGHTHIPWQLQRNEHLALNPGSVCATLAGKTGGNYAILSWENDQCWYAELHELHYDISLVRKAFENTGLLEEGGVFAERWLHDIESGINTLPMFVDYAYEQAAKARFPDSPFVPDDIWDESAKSFDKNYERGAL